MSEARRYPVPTATHRVEETILRSRFIATVGKASSVDAARAFVSNVAAEFADATHNCWAYVVGPPGDTSHAGLSDAGEPHGTAGRPMLTVLLGSGIGDVVAVVTRYFGGTKLGKGGLARAYGGAVKHALEGLPTEELVSTLDVRVELDYSAADSLKRALDGFEARIVSEDYATKVVLVLRLPVDRVEDLAESVRGLTNGRARVDRV